MSRRKGPPTLKFLDERSDDVAARNALWRGDNYAELQSRVCALGTAQDQLVEEISQAHQQLASLDQRLNGLAAVAVTLTQAKEERECGQQRRVVLALLASLQAKHTRIQAQLESARKQIAALPPSDRQTPVHAWQHEAELLILLHQLRTATDGVLGTRGATITTTELQKQLHASGLSVCQRQLRRYLEQRGVAGRQGERTDLTSDNSAR